MSSQTKKLVEVLRQRARLKGAPYSDKELEELVKTINPHSHSLYYIGSISFQDIRFDYLFLEWTCKTALVVKGREKDNKTTNYTIFYFSIDETGLIKDLIGWYFTPKSCNCNKGGLERKVTIISTNNPATIKEEMLLQGIIKDALNSKINSLDN